MIAGRVRHVLADALLAGPTQMDRRGDPGELRRDRELEALELVGLDLERQIRDSVVERHRREP